ncbi:MAG: hypothetical protein C0484_10385 [Rhodospirillum sp.]|nr:hypothetical protein [Rhodospirillum sp.]
MEDLMRTFFAIAISTFIPVHAFAGDMRPMSIDDMKAAIIGNSMSGETETGDGYTEHYTPDGHIVGLSKAAGKYEGTWSFRQDGLMCFRYGDGVFDGGCVRLSRDGDRIGLTRVDGSVEPTATLIEGMAPQLK